MKLDGSREDGSVRWRTILTTASVLVLSQEEATLKARSERPKFFHPSCKILRRRSRVLLCKKRKRALRMLLSIVVAFAVLNLPFHVWKLCRNYLRFCDMGYSRGGENPWAQFTLILLHASCAVNPLLHAFMSQGFRASLKDLLRCCFCQQDRCQRTL